MKVYLDPPAWIGHGIKRVAAALQKHAPAGVNVVQARQEADLEIVHVVGWGSLPETLGQRPYAAVQYCWQTTEDSHPKRWAPVWEYARAVWSYYDLPTANLLHQPLGVDGDVFHFPEGRNHRPYKLGTTGYVDETECISECAEAVRRVGGFMAHLGPDLNLGTRVTSKEGLPDTAVAELWGGCERVAGLRRTEGFELPAYEGLACGARPLVFDRPHYRTWLGEHADYAEEVEAERLKPLLAEILSTPPRPVTEAERTEVLALCNWEKLCGRFWEATL